MAPLYYTLGVVIFVVALMASIALHECGHMIPAKKFGARVPQFFVGFGRTIWSKRVGETEYGIKQIPLGGYVKIIGMLPPDKEGKLRETNTGLFTQLIADARAAEWELVQEGDDNRLFYKLPWWKKVIVMAGGPTVNVLIAFFLFWALFATMGNAADRQTDPVITEVQPCLKAPSEDGEACTPAEIRKNPTPAYAAGIEVGDKFVTFNGAPIDDWDELRTLIRDSGDEVVTLGIERDGELISVDVTPRVWPVRNFDDNKPDEVEKVGFLGVVPTSRIPTGGPIYTLDQMGDMTVHTVHAIGTLPVKVWDVTQALFGLEERDPESPVSIVGGGRFAGEIASEEGFPVEEKTRLLVSLIAGFNLFIGLFNFVPLLPLDGGHIAGAVWEAIRRGWAKIFRRPDPGYVDVAKLLPIAYVMAAAFIMMSVVLVVADIFIPIHLT